MYSIALEFKTEQEMQAVADKLWNKHGVTGEFEMYQTANETFRLHVYSEKQIKDSVLEKLPGTRVQTRGNYGVAALKEAKSEDN